MKFINISEVNAIIKSNSLMAIGGFTINRKPIDIINQIAKSDIEDLSLFTLAGSLDVDLLLKNKKIKKIFAAYVGYEGLGGSQQLRKFVENKEVEFEDLTEISYYLGLKAGSMGVEFIPTKSLLNSDILKISSFCKKISILGEEFCAVKAIKPDFCIIHAHKSDKNGNISINSPDFAEKEMAQASKITIFSVEEIGELKNNEITISNRFVDYVIVAKNGANPTGCNGFYPPDIPKINEFIKNGKF